MLATILSITDPFGRLVKVVVKSRWGIDYAFTSRAFTRGLYLGKRKEPDHETLKGADQYTLNKYYNVVKLEDPGLAKILISRTLSTNSISYEIDKIISTMYFIIILIGIFIASYSDTYLENINQLFNSTNGTQLKDTSNITYQLTNTTVTVRRDPNISTSPVIYQISNTTTITGQPTDNTTSSICNTPDCENGTLVLRILLILAIIGVGYIAYLSIKKLFSRNRMLATYFFVRESVIPKLDEKERYLVSEESESASTEPRALSQSALQQHKAVSQNITKYNQELLDYIKSQDWGMAEFFEGELLRSNISISNTRLIL